jgi:DNA-binding transcriptional ArsR family regulator
MVQRRGENLDRVLAAVADPTRRAIVQRLARGSCSISELAEPHQISLPGVMKHVRVLEGAGLVRHEKRGRTRYCELTPGPLEAVDGWLADYRRFWGHQLDALVDHFRER